MTSANVYNIVVTILLCVAGFLFSYLKTKSTVIRKAGDFINKAEENWASVSHAGAEKFQWVVKSLHSLLPMPLKPFITEAMIAEIVQKVFDSMAEYATKQLDKVVDKI